MAEARNFENSQECKDMIAEIKAGNNSGGTGTGTGSGSLINPTLPGNGSYSKPLPSGTDLGFVSFKKTSFTVSQANQTFNNVYSWADDAKDNYINVGGGYFIKVDKFFPSSQLCHCCGFKNSKLKDLSIRRWDCPACGTKNIDRDINAAQNIKYEGLRLLSA